MQIYIHRVVFVVPVFMLLLTACGQRGDLYLPDRQIQQIPTDSVLQ